MIKSIKAARNPHDSSSRRSFNCAKTNNNEDNNNNTDEDLIPSFDQCSYSSPYYLPSQEHLDRPIHISCILPKPKLSLSKFTSLFTSPSKSPSPTLSHPPSLRSKVVGTLFGHRRGHVHVAFQDASTSAPAFLIELSTPTSVLVKEMASGLVKVALECDKTSSCWEKKGKRKKKKKLLEEPLWRAYCNGKKCGYAMTKECGPHEWRVLRSVGPITMGAGVLPGNGSEEEVVVEDGEVMYMRARFERVVGSKDCEAFYMMNPDGSGGPELSVYLLRV